MRINTATECSSIAINWARVFVYRLLSLAISDPKSARWTRLRDDSVTSVSISAAQLLRNETVCNHITLAPGERTPKSLNLAPLVRLLREPNFDINAQYERIFGLMMSKKCPPYETEFCPQTFSVYRSQTLADIAGFYRAFGVEPSRDTPERDDHISLELGFMSFLIAKEQRAIDIEQVAICHDAQERFAREHLVWWVPAFAHALEQQCQRMLSRSDYESSIYKLLAEALAAFIPIERAILEIESPKELVAPSSIEPQEEMSCSACTGSCGISSDKNYL